MGLSQSFIEENIIRNRIGVEPWNECEMTFYGSSFLAGAEGEKIIEMGDAGGVARATLDLDAIRTKRRSWGIFRDRRRDLYRDLL